MERILNQGEIDELLAAFDGGEIDDHLREEPGGRKTAPSSRPARQVSSIDLTRGQNYSKWRIANLDVVFNSFARYYSISLSNSLQQGVTVKKGEIVSRFFDDFIGNLPDAGLLGAFNLEPLKGSGVFVFDKDLCFGLVQLMLGGGASTDMIVLDRDVTAIEANIIKSLMKEGCSVLNRAFSSLDVLESSMGRVETNPRLLSVLAPDTEVIQVGFTVQAGDLEGEILMIIPYFSLEPFKDKLRADKVELSENTGDGNWHNTLRQELMDMEVPVAAVWGELHLTIQDILSLEEGDIIGLDYDEDAPVRILAGDRTKFRAHPGIQNGKKAVRLSKTQFAGE